VKVCSISRDAFIRRPLAQGVRHLSTWTLARCEPCVAIGRMDYDASYMLPIATLGECSV
jgi:hypothetical protein